MIWGYNPTYKGYNSFITWLGPTLYPREKATDHAQKIHEWRFNHRIFGGHQTFKGPPSYLATMRVCWRKTDLYVGLAPFPGIVANECL